MQLEISLVYCLKDESVVNTDMVWNKYNILIKTSSQ